MDRYLLIVALYLCPFLTVNAEILNGFYQKKMLLENKINHCEDQLNQTSDTKRVKQLKKELKKMHKNYAIVSRKFSETEQLLSAVKEIDPELYKRVSEITNAEGTLTQVVVQYVSRVDDEYTIYVNSHYKADAYTSVRSNKDNSNICESRFGTNTITITIGYGCDARKALGHEFAHVLYIVPNLASYMEYWNRSEDFCSGHHIDDPSFNFLEKIEGAFFQKHHEYMRRGEKNESDKPNLATAQNGAQSQ